MVASEDQQIASMIKGVLRRQFDYILKDPYANTFNETANGSGYQDDETDMSPIVWERKYEIDSLCFPIQLAYFYWKETNDLSIFDNTFFNVVRTILKTWKVEQNHDEQSSYRFHRKNVSLIDTLPNDGKGSETAWTGMTWTRFRQVMMLVCLVITFPRICLLLLY
ncbi:glycoside hydrolase family 125 protein [Metabacillus sp. KUDC1714]|uniref:Glycoside hydrolase family 125 protein n=1 Tax=Metabacillus elymi TaxID=2745198 RepID=A0ABX6S938_9BACI|nr:glycoside hydrolase family 125 protein [Metabacillus sp. KUDC1714]